MRVILCSEDQINVLARLFNDYRIFYEHPSDLESCRAFVKNNLVNNRSRLFLVSDTNGMPVGFAQIYSAISSLSMLHYYYLSDLYIDKSARGNGYSRDLMNFITDFCATEGAERLTLDTAISNKIAQNLYESLGYKREEVYVTYHQRLPCKEIE